MSRTSLNASDANRLVFEAYGSGWESYTPKRQYVFREIKPQRVDEKFSVHASGGDLPSVAEGAAFPKVNVEEIGSKTFSAVEYKRAIPVTRLMQEYDNYGVVIDEARKEGYKANLTMDRVGANILNGAFGASGSVSATTTWDGENLASNSHNVGDTGTTQDNLISGDLSESTLNDAQVNLRKMKDHNGQELALLPRTLVVPPEEAKKAFELTASQGSPESANNNSNFFNTLGLNVVVWELLTGADDCFLLADKLFTRLEYLVYLPPEMDYVRIDETGNWEYQCQFDVQAGATDYLGVQCIQGA